MDSLIQSFGFAVAMAAMIGIFLAVVREDRQSARKLDNARRAYAASLDTLRDDPRNSNLRKRTLQLGREFAYLMREEHGYSDFDESHLVAEIDEACEEMTADRRVPGLMAHLTI